MEVEEVGKQVVDSAIKVHRTLGPGLLESAYQACLTYELRKRGLKVECELDQLACSAGKRWHQTHGE